MRGPLVAGGAADQAHPLDVLGARLRHRRQERVQAGAVVLAHPAAVAVLTARAQRLGRVLGHVLAAADRAARIPEQGIGRVGHEAPARRVPATTLKLTQIDQRREPPKLAVVRRRRRGERERHKRRPASEPGTRCAVSRSTASRWRPALGMQVDLGRGDARVPEQRLVTSSPPAAIIADAAAWRSMCGVTRRSSSARVDNDANSSRDAAVAASARPTARQTS